MEMGGEWVDSCFLRKWNLSCLFFHCCKTFGSVKWLWPKKMGQRGLKYKFPALFLTISCWIWDCFIALPGAKSCSADSIGRALIWLAPGRQTVPVTQKGLQHIWVPGQLPAVGGNWGAVLWFWGCGKKAEGPVIWSREHQKCCRRRI